MSYRTPEPKNLEYEEPWEEIEDTIDEEMKGICTSLHFLGYPVVQSCAGHPLRPRGGGFRKRGFIEFEGQLLPKEKREVLDLAQAGGLCSLRFWYDKEHDVTELYFSPVGTY